MSDGLIKDATSPYMCAQSVAIHKISTLAAYLVLGPELMGCPWFFLQNLDKIP